MISGPMWPIFHRFEVCIADPGMCASGLAASPTANATVLLSIGVVALFLAYLSKDIRVMMALTGGYLIGFAHHIFVNSASH